MTEAAAAQCSGKHPLTCATAWRIVRRDRKHGVNRGTYRCRYCGKWHLCHTCDDCGAEVSIAARHGDSGRHVAKNRMRLTLHSEPTVIDALRKEGWTHVKNRLRCPKCVAARAEKQKEANMAAVTTATRQMTPDMKLDIMEALFSVYDRKAKRYSGQETDTTVAEAVGGGCMPGWVAEVRAANFGPAGNEEAEAIRAEIKRIEVEMAKSIAALTARLDALYKAEDKRVRT